MRLTDFDFHIPEELVAQKPLEQREASRMLVVNRAAKKIEHLKFIDLPNYLHKDDLMVFNQSKVIKARLIGHRSTGGKVEAFLLKQISENSFECLVKATAGQKIGLEFSVEGKLDAKITRATSDPMIFVVELMAKSGNVREWIEELGKVPLPPYIHRDAILEDSNRYQTVYAKEDGSVAAPTAGLHFTPAVLEKIQGMGVNIDFVTLHVGLGTFQPIKVDEIDAHKMHTENFYVSPELRLAAQNAKRLIAVGTTSVRALESAARGKEAETDLFLKPGEEFKWVDAMFTNFHQPKSSLVVMLSAFLGDVEFLKEIYAKAVEEKYRFFSYGDCMLVL